MTVTNVFFDAVRILFGFGDTSPADTTGTVDLSDSPVALDDATFDRLFPADGPSQEEAPAPQAPVNATPEVSSPAPVQTQPVAQPPAAPFLKGDQSVYNSPEAALEGINQKDALIAQMRQRYQLATGIDPITGQPVQYQPPQQPVTDYYNSPDKYLNDLVQAAKAGPAEYRDVQTKFMMDTLKPLAPVMQRAALDQALGQVSGEIKDIGTFVQSPLFRRALEAVPELGSAYATATQDYRWHDRLPGLIKMAYLTGQGLQAGDLLRAQASAVAPQTSTAPARPTMQSSTIAPPQTTAKPSLGSVDGIKAIIADAEARGAKLDF